MASRAKVGTQSIRRGSLLTTVRSNIPVMILTRRQSIEVEAQDTEVDTTLEASVHLIEADTVDIVILILIVPVFLLEIGICLTPCSGIQNVA